jgi:hypothetical protein
MEIDDKIKAFRVSISSNLLASDDFIDWQVIDENLASSRPAIRYMQHFLDCGDVTRDGLAQLLHQHPSTYPLLLDLIAFSSSGAQVEKWGLPQLVNADQARTTWVAGQLMHVGIGKILTAGTAVEPLLRIAEVYKDGFRRRFRSAGRLDERTRLLVITATQEANKALEQTVRLDPNALADAGLRRSLSFILAVGNRPIAGIARFSRTNRADVSSVTCR